MATKKKTATAKKKTRAAPATKKKAATKKPLTLAERWKQVADWLGKNHPEALKEFNRPAKTAAIEKAEKALKRTLPADYKAFLALHNGQDTGGHMVEWGTLLEVEEIAREYKELTHLDSGDEDGEGNYETDNKVKGVFYSKGWIPIGRSPRGRDYLCLDFDPGKRGVPGQVILFIVDDNERFQIAPSFAELLTVFLKEAKSGEIEF